MCKLLQGFPVCKKNNLKAEQHILQLPDVKICLKAGAISYKSNTNVSFMKNNLKAEL